MTEEAAIEKAIVEKGLTAPRITPTMLDEQIVAEQYSVFPGSCTTVCELTLKNGFTVTGTSACAHPANFNAEIGRQIARTNARNNIWPLLGYELKTQLALVESSASLDAGDPLLVLGDVQTYVGTKVVFALPMDRGDYNIFRGWEVPANEDPRDEGYLVQYADGGKPNVPGYSGYISWSPRDIFEGSYRRVGTPIPTKTLTFHDRLKREHDELASRLTLLKNFLGDPESQNKMSEAHYNLLMRQASVMGDYLHILVERLEDLA